MTFLQMLPQCRHMHMEGEIDPFTSFSGFFLQFLQLCPM